MTEPVSEARIGEAFKTLWNVRSAALACREADITFPVACALLEQESLGKNVYGHDKGGALSGYPYEVTRDNFLVFRWLVGVVGMKSNGVGPCQITYFPYFEIMMEQELRPWNPYDNMVFGFRILKDYKDQFGTWRSAFGAYNGGPSNPDFEYAQDVLDKLAAWKERFRGL